MDLVEMGSGGWGWKLGVMEMCCWKVWNTHVDDFGSWGILMFLYVCDTNVFLLWGELRTMIFVMFGIIWENHVCNLGELGKRV